MKALCWYGTRDVRVEEVPDPKILAVDDIIIKTSTTAICGSDLHLYHGTVPMMEQGDILGHEFMGTIVEKGPDVKDLKVGDRVIIPFAISCGHCFFCKREHYSCCDNTNPKSYFLKKMNGDATAGIFGYSHLMGGYAGGQAEYVRVPYANVGPARVTSELDDDDLAMLTDAFPTGYMAAENCSIQPGDTVAVWGCGPIGQFAIRSAYLLGAHEVIAIDVVPGRLKLAEQAGATIVNASNEDEIVDRLKQMTGGMGPDACIDAVGYEAESHGAVGLYDTVKQTLMMTTDSAQILRQVILSCRKAGVVSLPGVYVGMADKVPMGALMNKALTIKTGQTHIAKYMRTGLQLLKDGKIKPSEIISHRLSINDAANGYKIFDENKNEVTKIVLKC